MRNLEIPEIEDFVSERGYGTRAQIHNQQIIVGHKNFFLSFCSLVQKKLASILDNETPNSEPYTTTIVGTLDKIIGILFLLTLFGQSHRTLSVSFVSWESNRLKFSPETDMLQPKTLLLSSLFIP